MKRRDHALNVGVAASKGHSDKKVFTNEAFTPDSNEGFDDPSSSVKVEVEARETRFTYDVFESPNIILTIFFAMQQVLMSLSNSLSTSLLVADIVCAGSDENYKAKLLSTTLFISGVTTFLQNTIGIRLPLYQGPAATYVVPLLALSSLENWQCPDYASVLASNAIQNITENITEHAWSTAIIMDRTQKLEGSLMITGAIHFLVGATGLVGLLLRFIGPITVIPALTVVGLYVYKATTKFAQTQWGVSLLTVAVSLILSFYLRHRNTPVPAWSRDRGCHIKWLPVHKMFSIRLIVIHVLLACLIGWGVSAILTVSGALSDDPDNVAYFARTDSRLEVIADTPWLYYPYPGQFGPPGFDAGAFMVFLMGTISSIIDSVGDYYACVKICEAPLPPKHAVNRGIAVEGILSFIGGWSGASHATTTFGSNIGAIGTTRVASLRVFQCVGVIFIIFGIVGKIGAVFVTIPYSVVGGMLVINFGVLIGVVLSNMQFIDMQSTRNLAIIGISLLMAFMLPHWINTADKPIDTGNATADNIISMFLANPPFVSGVLACFLDNTIPGTLEERGMAAWHKDMGMTGEEAEKAGAAADSALSPAEKERKRRLLKTIYNVPLADRLLRRIPCLKHIPFYPS